MQAVDTNTSTLNKEDERKVQRAHAGAGSQSNGELAKKILELGRSVPKPGEEMHRLAVESISVPSQPVPELFKHVPEPPALSDRPSGRDHH